MRAIDSLIPRLEAELQASDLARRLPADVVAELKDAGAYSMVLPKALGGLEVDLATYLKAIERVSEGSAASWLEPGNQRL